MMKKIVNGVYIEMTEEEIAEFEANKVDESNIEISGQEILQMLGEIL